MRNKKLIFLYSLPIVIVSFLFVFIFLFNTKPSDVLSIEEILETEAYAYLSPNIKEYIKNYYNETGIVLLTEKNKISGQEYLNPDYIEYLNNGSITNTGYVPNEFISDYDYTYNANALTDEELPTQYDSRNVDGKNYVTPKKKQYSNLCWDFAYTSVIESKLLKEGLETDETTLDLAERVIDYSTTDPISAVDTEKNPYYGNYSLNSLAEGGNEYRYSSVLINGIFPTNESYWTYGKEFMGKVKPEDLNDFNKTPYQVNETLFIKDNNLTLGLDEDTNKLLKQYIIEHGSIGISLRVGAGRNYVSYVPTGGEEPLNSDTNRNKLYFKPNNAQYQSNDHEVAIIGWDDEYVHNVCIDDLGQLSDATNSNGIYICTSGTLKTINGAWISKDSADQSNHYVAYETVNSTYYTVTDVSLKDWDNVYASSNKESYTLTENYIYNFTKQNNIEKITSIKFYSPNAISNKSMYINTYDGTGRKLLTTINTEIGGLYTIPVEEEIILSNDTFSIEISGLTTFSIFTTNQDSTTVLKLEDTEIINSFNTQGILEEHQNLIKVEGISRNVNENINIIIENSDNIDVTNLFTIIRNYPVGNYVSAIIKFNNDVGLGTYTASAYVNGTLQDIFEINIDKYMENVSGDGSIENPFIITNPTQLDMMRLNSYNFYKLGNDIDLTYDTQNPNGLFYNDGRGWDPIDYSNCSISKTGMVNCSDGFSGMLDGNGYKIIGLYINRPDEDIVGLFRNTYNNNYSGLNFKNLIFKDVDITGNNYVGTVIGYAFGTTYERTLIFENITVIGNVKGNNYVGGLIGYYKAGTGLPNYILDDTECTSRHCLDNLFNSANISGNSYIGGIVGLLETQTYYNHTNPKWRSTIVGNNWQNNGTITASEYGAGLIGHVIINNGNSVTINNAITTDKTMSNAGIFNNVECKNAGNTYPTCSVVLKNIYYTNNEPYLNSGIITSNNVTKYTISELTDSSIYEKFTNFNTMYTKAENKIPFVKNAYVEHTSVEDITLYGTNSINLYDYINGGNTNIIYDIDDDSIASIDQYGEITPIKSGTTKIHITSYYDGYDNEINLEVDNDIETYTITYNLDGGTATNPTSYTILSDTFALNQPTKVGYTFIGWTGSNGATPQLDVLITKGTTGNLTYTANWTPLKYIVTFDKNGGVGIMADQIFEHDIYQQLTKNTYKKEGYTFKYWNTKQNGTGKSYSNGESIKIRENLKLYAIWEADFDYIISGYQVDEKNKYIDLIDLNTSVEEFKLKIELNADFTIDVDYKTINGKQVLYTGGKTKIYKNKELYAEYTNIIRGDVNGNGVMDIIDYIRIMKDIMNTSKLTDVYRIAADVNKNNTVDIIDYIRIMKKIMEEN